MRLWKSMLIARKEWMVLKKRKGLIYGIIALPSALGVLLPSILYYLMVHRHLDTQYAIGLISSFGFFFVIMGALLPVYTASSSIVTEKLEKSLEPLLATPTEDSEILMGKAIATFVPTILSILLGASIFMVMADLLTAGKFGYLFYPNWTFALAILVADPLACIFSTGFCVFASSKTSSVQYAQILSIVPLIPFFVMYVMGEIGEFNLASFTNLALISAGLLFFDLLVFYISSITFNRERILTQWK